MDRAPARPSRKRVRYTPGLAFPPLACARCGWHVPVPTAIRGSASGAAGEGAVVGRRVFMFHWCRPCGAPMNSTMPENAWFDPRRSPAALLFVSTFAILVFELALI